jgi:hypothetical protein
LGVVASFGRAYAADYTIDFAVRTKHGDEVGAIACSFGDTCIGRMRSLGIYFDAMVDRGSSEEATVFMHGSDVSCCYFSGAATSTTVDTRKRLAQVLFYIGHAARGGLFIENHYAGALYLSFSFTSASLKASKNR